MTVFIDASFLIALFHEKDYFHSQAISISEKIKKESTQTITSNIVLAEAINFIYRNKGSKVAKKFSKLVEQSGLEEFFVSSDIFNKAYSILFQQKTKRGVNFFDCLHLATIKSLGIQKMLTFDQALKRKVKEIS